MRCRQFLFSGGHFMDFLQKLAEINSSVNGVVWGTFGLALLIGTGVIITVCTKFFQISHFGHWWKKTVGNMFSKEVLKHRKEKGTISPFQALCTALAATVGTGNIAGVAAAICIGGAGAVFWMWVAAFFGMTTNYAENLLGIYFRRKNANGEWSGGAMFYLRDGLGGYTYKDNHCQAGCTTFQRLHLYDHRNPGTATSYWFLNCVVHTAPQFSTKRIGAMVSITIFPSVIIPFSP
jgi:Na+/alanine symporter